MNINFFKLKKIRYDWQYIWNLPIQDCLRNLNRPVCGFTGDYMVELAIYQFTFGVCWRLSCPETIEEKKNHYSGSW